MKKISNIEKKTLNIKILILELTGKYKMNYFPQIAKNYIPPNFKFQKVIKKKKPKLMAPFLKN